MTFTETVTLTRVDCPTCGATFAINERYREVKQQQGGYWNCPYCQNSLGYGVSENDRLKRELAEKNIALTSAKCDALREQQSRQQFQKKHEEAERKLRRVKNGVCPCCNRSFQNLQRHMKTKHPEQANK